MTVYRPLMNNWHVVLKIDVLLLTPTCCFAKTFEEENCVMYVLHNHAM